MSTVIYQVDAFTDTPFGGNPAGVCLLDEAASESWMQKVATEMALSETAFLVREDQNYNLRWFTPVAEVDLCGHATLASAHFLAENGHISIGSAVTFNTASGQLKATVSTDGSIKMDFPSEEASDIEITPAIRQAVGLPIVNAGRNRIDFIVEVESEEALTSFVPDHSLITKLDSRGLIMTSRATSPKIDFVSRYFAPALGVPEDPVTGSTHCCLAPYWATRLGNSRLSARQLSQRGGSLTVEVSGDRVLLTGQAVTTMKVLLLV